MYQEFFLAICETTDNRLIEAHEGKYLDVLCIGIINNIWGKRDRVKSYDKGSTHPLHEMHRYTSEIKTEEHNLEEIKEEMHCVYEMHLTDESSPYDYDKDQRVQKANDFIKELIDAKKESDDQAERFRSRVFYYSKYKYKNTRQFSKASGIPYNVCWEAVHKFKQLIKINLHDLRPDSGF